MNKLRDFLAGANRLQQAKVFKIIASVLVLVGAIAVISSYTIAVTAPAAPVSESSGKPAPAAEGSPAQPESDQDKEMRSAVEASQRLAREILARRTSPANLAIGAALVAGVMLVVVWLGLGLTYLALVGVALGLAYPLALLGWGGLSRVLLGMVALTASFTALMQGLRIAVSGPGPVFAIARNCLAEAVRLKVSLVFIVMLIFGLSALPLLMDPTTPLRYRVQSFLQYGTAGSYWIIAVLTLLFAVGSVTSEQRDRQIWQTMTKPVAPWQYILGKWLGVAGLSAVLLAVSCAGVFLFTDYLRRQPAVDESPQLSAQTVLSEDRDILENQVLAARLSTGPEIPLSPDDPEFQTWVKAYIEDGRKGDPGFASDEATLEKIESDLYKSYEQAYRTVPPGNYRTYVFKGLGEARRLNQEITLKYRIDSGSNMPDQLYHLTFVVNGILILPPSEVTLGPTHTLRIEPSMVNDNGELEIEVHNAAIEPTGDPSGPVRVTLNPDPISFPASGLEVFYPAGSFQMNFARVALVLWIKLAFLAILAITASTFLSFPVACLVAFSIFLMAEGTGFLSLSLEYYDAADQTGHVVLWKVPVRAIGMCVTWMFKTYSELRPTTRLVDGRLLEWGSVAWGATVLAAWSAALFGASVGVFRRRELATYSGN